MSALFTSLLFKTRHDYLPLATGSLFPQCSKLGIEAFSYCSIPFGYGNSAANQRIFYCQSTLMSLSQQQSSQNAMARKGNDGGFQRALARFKSHLSPAEQESFGVTSLQDVQKTIVQIQDTQGSQSKMRNLTRIKAFVEAMEQYGKVVEVFLNASSILAFVWVRQR